MNTDNTRDTEIIEEGREAVLNFQLYLNMFTSGELPDGKRFDNEFFEMYPFVKPNSLFHMMFCTFVGALDLAQRATDFVEERKKGSDATTETTK